MGGKEATKRCATDDDRYQIETVVFDLARSFCLCIYVFPICNPYMRACCLFTKYMFGNLHANLSGWQTLGTQILVTPSIHLDPSNRIMLYSNYHSAKKGKISAPMNPLDSEF